MCHYLWWTCAVVFFVSLFVVLRAALRSWVGFTLTRAADTHIHTHARTRKHTHTHTHWWSAPAKKPWFSRYLLPDDLVSTGWYMDPARARLFKSFLVFFFVYLNKRSNFVLLILPSLMYLVVIYCKSKAKYTCLRPVCCKQTSCLARFWDRRIWWDTGEPVQSYTVS